MRAGKVSPVRLRGRLPAFFFVVVFPFFSSPSASRPFRTPRAEAALAATFADGGGGRWRRGGGLLFSSCRVQEAVQTRGRHGANRLGELLQGFEHEVVQRLHARQKFKHVDVRHARQAAEDVRGSQVVADGLRFRRDGR
eukprot:CAMPEP_0177684354 /NCGR_PEP_ID=MMETSP0447-20121125/32386_1 /TAXON_ID=0 /ORGANISM="Stygamoeba regulata, Strain BSH-02190019" /LENGTH=138 /DNA_ID=CAMNT_0019194195 /DNA_START=155 /DNA_END=568 /DNA_ORIENTATION=-